MSARAQRRAVRGREPTLNRILVIRKTTCYMDMLSQNDVEGLALVHNQHPLFAGIKRTHDQSERCFQVVTGVLERAGLNYRSELRSDSADYSNEDLVITLGGDGSFIDASHRVSTDVPLLGVRSATSSHGHFCMADSNSFAAVLKSILSGEVRPRRLTRLSLTVDGEELPTKPLNEVLAGELDLAGTNRYELKVNGRTERQSGTGLVVGTASGSTGLLRSAGGIIQPVLARSFQYKPLLPILEPGERLRLPGGLVSPSAVLRVVSAMPAGLLHVDGRHIKYPFKRGSELQVRVSDQHLLAYVNPRAHDRYLNKR